MPWGDIFLFAALVCWGLKTFRVTAPVVDFGWAGAALLVAARLFFSVHF